MARFSRKADGRRIFTAEFKRKQIDRVWKGELTLADLSRELGIARSLLQRWKRLMPTGAAPVGLGTGRSAQATELRAAQYIRELQVLVGKQTVELELLRMELDGLKGKRRPRSRAEADWTP